MKMKVARCRLDMVLGKTTHTAEGGDCPEQAVLTHIRNGEDVATVPFTHKGIETAERIVREEGGYFMDVFGNIWVE